MARQSQAQVDGIEIEIGDHLIVTCKDSAVDQFEGENEMGAQRVEDFGTTSEVFFHDADGNEALVLTAGGIDRDDMTLKTTGGRQKVADVTAVEVVEQ